MTFYQLEELISPHNSKYKKFKEKIRVSSAMSIEIESPLLKK